MKNTLCNYFSIIDNSNLKLVNARDEDAEIEGGDSIQEMWEDIYDDDEVYLKITISGDPFVKFIINCEKVNNGGIESSISLALGLNLEDADANQVYSKFSAAFGIKLGLGESWSSRFKLLDNKNGELAENGLKFLKICQSYNEKSISPIDFHLEPKVHPLSALSFSFFFRSFSYDRHCVLFYFVWCLVQFSIQLVLETVDGDNVVSVDPQSTYSNVCNELTKKIQNWQEFYLLTEKDTKKEISAMEIYDNVVKTAKESESMGVTFLCKPKYTFIITNDTFEQRDETENKENTANEEIELEDNNFSFSYFGESETPFEDFVGKIRKRFSHIQEKFDLVFGGNNISDEMSFKKMIEDAKYENKSKIFVTLKIKVSLLFLFVFLFLFLWLQIKDKDFFMFYVVTAVDLGFVFLEKIAVGS